MRENTDERESHSLSLFRNIGIYCNRHMWASGERSELFLARAKRTDLHAFKKPDRERGLRCLERMSAAGVFLWQLAAVSSVYAYGTTCREANENRDDSSPHERKGV